jgi:hypothetical protein
MDSLVPERVSYQDFWMRYLFYKSNIDSEESKRKQLFESNVDDNKFDWDGDDVEDSPPTEEFYTLSPHKNSSDTVKRTLGQHPESAPRNSSTSETSSFDIVSQSSAVAPLAKDKVLSQLFVVDLRYWRLRRRVMMTGNNSKLAFIVFYTLFRLRRTVNLILHFAFVALAKGNVSSNFT